MTKLVGSTPYETWVVTLRAWSDDPGTPLDHLPALREDTFTAETFARLIAHLSRAMQAVSDRWRDRLDKVLANAHTTHGLARDLVALRSSLARRGQLASHPSLPQPIRDGLWGGFRCDVERWQSELEGAIRVENSRDTVDSRQVDALLRVVRENSLLAVLGYSTGVGPSTPTLAPLPERDPSAPISLGRRAQTLRRHVVPFTQG